MRKLILMGLLGLLTGLLSSCGDSSLEELQQHPLANPRVTVVEPARQTASSGDVSTGVLNGASKVTRVTTAYEHDNTAEQRDQIVAEIVEFAEELGCRVSLISNEERLPNGQYSIGCDGFGAVSTRMLVSPWEISVTLESFG